ncbi:hypothetical protein SRS16CHR_04809 [Variovorax sp. SRS16]|nr:hypothetical protein SRS16CHR_04809 [Variovorax sp. SRS16]
MSEMQLYDVEPRLVGTHGCVDEALHDLGDPVCVKGDWSGPTRTCRQGAGAESLPRFCVGREARFRQRCTALPQRLAARLATSMRQLHADGCAIGMHEIDDLFQCFDVAVLPETQIGSPDAPTGIDGSTLGQDQPRSA